ncbi:hypothetical protein B0J11DRAFT_441783 [Dendryphion nanum]|uniref:Uncharacterized protein n=1 Tax=Dendryphion nanum TaxID=256645 RepID=A0A9P9IF72_9PLEO|nr:hypothetical protein B0J11DRAFT_441783 [Dendryphion nanum]
MVTGVETAGLVLGSIPLILASLQFYANGVAVSKRYWRYRKELGDLVMELSSENAIYVNTINLLLKGIVKEKDMNDFLSNPCGAEWKDAEFDDRLKDRLGQTYQSYLDNISKMNAVAEEFKSKLKLAPTGKPQFAEVNLFKEHYKRLKFSVKKSDYNDLMSKLRRANFSLHLMTTQISSLQSAPAVSKEDRSQAAIPKFSIINDRAQGFYSALCSGWKCPCHANHSVNLRLESRMDDEASDDDSDDYAADSMRNPFHVVFRYSHQHIKLSSTPATINPWTWEEADVRIVNKTTPIIPSTCSTKKRAVKFADQAQKAVSAALNPLPNLQPIQDLCTAISTLGKPQRDVCLELLATAIAEQQYDYHIYPRKDPTINPEAYGDINTGDIRIDLMTEWTTADRLVDDLYSDAGGKYTDAVRRCIRCDFDHRASNLDDIAFQKAVYDGVVSQLKHSFDFLYGDCVFQPR